MTPEVHKLDGGTGVYEAAATVFERAAIDAVQAHGVFNVALAGGSTPRGLYSVLAGDPRLRGAIPWDRIQFFWGDERHVPPDHPDSNYGMAHEAMFSKVPVRPDQVHRVRAEHSDASIVADWYEAEVCTLLQQTGSTPRFDLILLGLGADGHTASIFPGTPAASERYRLVMANPIDRFGAYRITMTLPLINAASLVMFVVTGDSKAEAVRDVLQPNDHAAVLPAQLVRPKVGRVIWMLDSAAGRLLKETPV